MQMIITYLESTVNQVSKIENTITFDLEITELQLYTVVLQNDRFFTSDDF